MYLANDAEIAAVFSVPLDFFRQDPREHTHRIDYQGRSWYVPSYRFGEYKIWGLTAVMIVELVNLVFDAGIDLQQPPKPRRAVRGAGDAGKAGGKGHGQHDDDVPETAPQGCGNQDGQQHPKHSIRHG